MFRRFAPSISSVIAIGASRSFNFNFSDSAQNVKFDNGKEVEGWSFGNGSASAGNVGKGDVAQQKDANGFFSFPSALEAESNLPSSDRLKQHLPTAAEAEAMAMGSETISYDEDE